MIDLRALRQDPEPFRASQRAREADPGLIDELLAADINHRELLVRFEELRSEQKTVGKSVAQAQGEEKQDLLKRTRALAAEVKSAQAEADAAAQRVDHLQWQIPNLIVDGVPSGGEDDYVVLKTVGERREFDDSMQDHFDLGENLQLVDTVRGAKVSGSRFYFLTGMGARLELAILNLAMDTAVAAGFQAMITPSLVREEAMAGTGFLGEHAAEVYRLEKDDLYLVGTSEVALAGYHADEILDLSDGPKRYAGWSACYRREAGSHGKDTRGIIRVHQFHKVEMFSFVPIEEAPVEHERLLAWEEDMLAKVELPYRVIDTAAGDLGDSAARKYDCEAWLPSQNRFLELTSTSNCTTFQARRLKVRERTADGKVRTAATLNGTLATTRWLVTLLENHQLPDGSVHIPQALRPYLGGVEKIEAP
ncbi:MAG TPA: serine--tRNA ligase [Actinomycetales bacterium]|nr:serine--tRNA ligase [Actinomycetales bacterium]